jgi:phage major head subunit gpT-like protein
MSIEQAIQIIGHILEGQTPDPTGSEVRVTVLKGGKSNNGYAYNESTLRQVARLLEGSHAYADHPRTAADSEVRSIRDVVGFYHDATYMQPDAVSPLGRVDATLHIMESAQWLRSLIKEAMALGRPDLVGLSIDVYGTWQHNDSTQANDVTGILSLNSCDIVTRPSAGGSLQRILHSQGATNPMPDDPQTSQPTTPPADPPSPPQAPPAPAPLVPPPASQTSDVGRLTEAERTQLATLMNQVQLERCELQLERHLLEAGLPDPVAAQVRARFSGRVFEATALDADITAQRDMLAALAASGIIRGNNYEKPTIGSQITEAEKVQAAFDRMFDLEIDTSKLGNIRAFGSIREAYARVTGDPSVAGFTERSQLGNIRISEAAPITRITEADTTTASFSFLLGTSMNKRLLKDYQAWPAEWAKFCTITPIKDFKQQTRVRLGAFGSLSTVAEDTAYTTISLTDTAATYVPTKRGNLVTVSRETIVNDDLFAIKQIPTKLAVAAAYTLAEFVYAFLSSNPTIYDGNALFTSGGAHSNLGSSALSTAAMQTGVTSMREQTNYAGKRLGLRPRYLVVPPELEFVAMVVTKSAGVPGSVNNDINPMLGYVTPIVSPQLTNATQWFFSADPMVVDTIEIGFVGGQVNPALFIQDQPLFGLNFTQDVISYKIRHEYGGAVVDYRGLYRGI